MHESSVYQADTLCLFTMLTALRANWAGRLILSCGLGSGGTNLALAANVAGAACLSIDRSPEACRAALRRGAVDFVVNSLDEALRALKNEIRKGQPLSVALEGDLGHELAQTRERGLLPEAFTGSLWDSSGSEIANSERVAIEQTAASLELLGTLLVDFDGTLAALPNARHGWDRLSSFTAESGWKLESFDFDSLAALRSFDARVRNLPSLSEPRRRWAIAASRYFQRSPSPGGSLQRYVYLTADEKHLLTR